jgi:hypothetical protein
VEVKGSDLRSAQQPRTQTPDDLIGSFSKVDRRPQQSRVLGKSRSHWCLTEVWLANCYFSFAAGHVTLLHFVLGLARIELVVADFKGIGAG